MKAYTVPASIPRSTSFSVRLNGTPVEVYSTGVADFILLSGEGAMDLEVLFSKPIRGAVLKPLRLGIEPVVEGASLHVMMEKPENALLEVDGVGRLFLFVTKGEGKCGNETGRKVRYYGGGRVYDEGVIRLESNETLYVEGGTVLRACIVAENATGIRICGHGVMDGTREAGGHPMITLGGCRDCVIEDVTLVRPTTWMVILGGCENIRVENLHEIGEVVCSDGIDVVGSRHVEVKGCMLCNNDDCVVVKAMHKGGGIVAESDWRGDVRQIRVHDSSFYNLGAGNAMEIGFELRSDVVEDVVFENLDVLAAHQNAAVFSIHNGDHAVVRHIRYRDIRVEHCWNKLVDIRILRSRYSKDGQAGQVEDVSFERIRCVPNVYNTPSLIGGYDPEHRVSGVVFEDFRLGEKVVRSADELELYTLCADGIEFR